MALNLAFGSRFPTEWAAFVISHLTLSLFVILPTIYISRQIILDAEINAGRQAIDLLFEKLPMKLRGATPFALSAEGNYVRGYTERGDDLIMSTFEEAVRAVSGIPGAQGRVGSDPACSRQHRRLPAPRPQHGHGPDSP